MTNWRRVSDLLLEMRFLEVQVQMLRDPGPHLTRDRGLRVAALHQRLDELERRLRSYARERGDDEGASLGELRRRLAKVAAHDPRYSGPERRKHGNERLRSVP